MQSRDQAVVVCWLCPRANYWVLTNSSGTVLTVPATLTRDTAYPIPK